MNARLTGAWRARQARLTPTWGSYTWGNNQRALNQTAKPTTVEYFLDYFYGYVAAK